MQTTETSVVDEFNPNTEGACNSGIARFDQDFNRPAKAVECS
jgi:hypothetical protein